eukprot:scaffold439_cov415-Prasinococcus_capsulatus_cf.AAC.19
MLAEVCQGRALAEACMFACFQVFTLGRRARREEFHSDEAAIRANVKAEIVEVPRGGEATWHGPGQAVLYPIVHLRQAGLGPRRYVELLEQAMVRQAYRHEDVDDI